MNKPSGMSFSMLLIPPTSRERYQLHFCSPVPLPVLVGNPVLYSVPLTQIVSGISSEPYKCSHTAPGFHLPPYKLNWDFLVLGLSLTGSCLLLGQHLIPLNTMFIIASIFRAGKLRPVEMKGQFCSPMPEINSPQNNTHRKCSLCYVHFRAIPEQIPWAPEGC